MKMRSISLIINSLFFLAGMQVFSQVPAFPGAEGFGAYAKGGRGGDVYIVSNLNDSGQGSLREAIKSAKGPRTIVFSVSGIIQLKSNLVLDHDNITIAGQTAPGDGICMRDAAFVVNASDVIVRFLRVRLGSEAGKEEDAVSITGGHNIMMDHCSASWSIDECFSCSTEKKDKLGNVTVQWCIISEALNKSIHSKGPHGYGALIRGCYGAKYTYHHNLFAHNASRNPRPGNYDINNYKIDPEGLLFDFRNNVIFNWEGISPGYDSDQESVCRFNFTGNFAKPGANSDATGLFYRAGCTHFKAYFSDNSYDGYIPSDQYSLVRFGSKWTNAEIASFMQDKPFETGTIRTEKVQDAYKSVLAKAGASLKRDAVDMRVINDVKKGAGSIINSEKEVGGWPEYKTTTAPADIDMDGMSDSWETKKGLNPNNPEDRNGDKDKNGYTDLEDYLNSLVLKR
jgi:pectate lyase